MNADLILLALFALIMSIFLYAHRDRVTVQWFVKPILGMIMYRTTWGLRVMDRLGTWRGWTYGAPIINFIGITGMILISMYLFKTLIDILTGSVRQAAALVLPVKSSITFYVPFSYWILSILIIASVHELAHGVLARHYGIRIKNSGFAFLHVILPIIPAAFVEPDEEELKKRKGWEKIAVYSAGPVSNILLAFLLIPLSLALSPLVSMVFQPTGVIVGNLTNYSALANTSFQSGEKIIMINNTPIHTLQDLKRTLENLTPGSSILLVTNRSNYTVTLLTPPDDRQGAWLGVQGIRTDYQPRDAYAQTPLPSMLEWLATLIGFLIILNLGIGLVNLLPIFIADGAHILNTLLKDILHLPEEKALHITGMTSMIMLIILLATLFLPHML